MSKKKKSFFGKFMKPKEQEEAPEGEKNENTENDQPEKSVRVSSEENAPQSKAPQSQEKQDEEWATDYEGQLTIDVYQTESDIMIKSTIAGVTPEDIDITIDNDMVIIKGERQNCLEVPEDDYYYQECYWGSLSRSVILPCDVEADKVQAELKNGILTVALPKVNKSKTKKVSVKAG
jgi:HSP20 family protein